MNSITVINYYYLLKRGFPQFAMPGGDVHQYVSVHRLPVVYVHCHFFIQHSLQCVDSLICLFYFYHNWGLIYIFTVIYAGLLIFAVLFIALLSHLTFNCSKCHHN